MTGGLKGLILLVCHNMMANLFFFHTRRRPSCSYISVQIPWFVHLELGLFLWICFSHCCGEKITCCYNQNGVKQEKIYFVWSYIFQFHFIQQFSCWCLHSTLLDRETLSQNICYKLLQISLSFLLQKALRLTVVLSLCSMHTSSALLVTAVVWLVPPFLLSVLQSAEEILSRTVWSHLLCRAP